MPRISDLASIKDEIYKIANEKDTLKEWGEEYQDVPLPELSENEPDQASKPEDANTFDDAISSLDLNTEDLNPDNLFTDTAQSDKPEVPETLLSEKADENNQNSDLDLPKDLLKNEGESVFTNGADLSDALFDTTDFNADDESIEQADKKEDRPFEDFDIEGLDDFTPLEVPNDMTKDSDASEDKQASKKEDAPRLSDSTTTTKDTPEKEDTARSSTESFPDSDADFNLETSPTESPSENPATKEEATETEDAYKPVQELDGVQVPEIDEETGFAKKDDGIDSSFNPPKRFENFADDGAKVFINQSVQNISDADVQGDIPLAISEKDFQKLLSSLDKMPYNLRQEIQKYLAYDKDLEVSKMELVDMIVKDAPLRKIVRFMEDNLQKSIKIPRGFDRKTFEELEREKATFKYRFRHQILPLMTMATIITLLLCSLFVVAWHFVYRPIRAESYYKDGLFYIQSGNSETAIERFDKAGTFWKKKRWYFRYANEFRAKKQYSAAEAIYLRLLSDFNHDVKGGIAYSEMLSVDLRDFEKAETVLRRQVLDYHPQSLETHYALASLYLDWGFVDNRRFKQGGKIFEELLQKYPNNDIYNAGMMKYHIRTDNLEKVLAFKDYFLKKGNRISQVDLNELGGYLLNCLYEASPNVSLDLKSRINDLREVLEKAHKMNENNPEANYNLGRFFVYNYKADEAAYYLKRAALAYDEKILPLAQFFKKMDALRLYGDVLLTKEQHLEAETVFVNALKQYRAYAMIADLPANKVVGKLFESYGDIKYFIANDYELALASYTDATKQDADSPELRYKMGYIQYQLKKYDQACTEFGRAYAKKSNDIHLLFSLGNSLFKRADYQVAQGYYERLMEKLDAEKQRQKIMLPQLRDFDTLFVENYMKATNNLAVTLNRLAVQNGNSEMNARSFALFGESTRSWDALTRNPKTLIRVKNQQAPAYVNVQYMTVPNKNFVPEIYSDIPKTLENMRELTQVR